jgi:hypothetical protein
MEPLVILAGLGALGYYAVKKIAQRQEQASVQNRLRDLNEQQRRQFERELHLRRERARHEHVRLNQLYTRMQAGLLQLGQAPDFQRAASVAEQARDVPAAYRQQQFRRFRSTLVDHFRRRLTAGANDEQLRMSLTALVQALGMAEFEAEYIAAEARQRLPRPPRPATASYDEHLQRLQTEHEQRMTTLRSLVGLDEELREQLLEAEQSRHREALLAAGNQQPQPSVHP